jgi:hypothetical protein
MRPIRLVLAIPCLAAAALGSGACSDPVPLIPRGAWALTFQDPGADCNVATHNAAVGVVGSSGEIEYKSDGTDDAEVECTVEASGGAFSFSGRVRYKGQYLSISSDSLKGSATQDDPSTGSVQLQTVQSTDIYGSDECIFYFNGNGQTIEAGRVWGSFQCPAVVGGAGDTCVVQQGYFAFENCVGSAEEEEE